MPNPRLKPSSLNWFGIRPTVGLISVPDDTVYVTGSPPEWWSWSVIESLKFVHGMGDNMISIALPGEGPGQCDKPFYSKESLLENQPKLVVSVDIVPDVSGYIKLKSSPLANRRVILKQKGEPNQTTKTDANGYYEFQNVVSGKRFKVIIKGPVVP